MKRLPLLLIGILTFLVIALAFTSQEMEKSKEPAATATSLPSSLDALFPPKAEQPVFLFRMFGIGIPLTGIVSDLFENDFQHARANFEKFKAQYVEVSKLVPEWQTKFPMGPVEKLGAALEQGDQGKVMAAIEEVGKVCADCHVAAMPKVQQKYHWGDFGEVIVKDPLTNEDVDFPRLMQFLNANFVGITLDAEQGQAENAQKQFQGFNARFQALKEACDYCHDTERRYYVDDSVQSMRDMDETLAFYQKLGFRLTGCHPDKAKPTWAEVRRDSVVLQFHTEPPCCTPPTPVCSGTFYMFPESVAELAEELRGKVEFAWGPDYGMREFAVQDPNGYYIAFTEPA
jgi:cytochrome c556/catechol 2,3-dioxygenase-like lactoylglutathione lyase family enzyme